MNRLLMRFPGKILSILLVGATLLQYINFKHVEAHSLIVPLSIIKYFTSLIILGIAGVCVINIFIKQGFFVYNTNVFVRFSRAFPVASIFIIAFFYAVISRLGDSLDLYAGPSPLIVFLSTMLIKAIGAVCMAFIALCFLQRRKE